MPVLPHRFLDPREIVSNAWDKDQKELLVLFILLHSSLLVFSESGFWKIECQNFVSRFSLHIKQVSMSKGGNLGL